MRILITGGTVFVSKYIAEYFIEKGEEVYVLNRNTRIQLKNAILINSDRKEINDLIKDYKFDTIIDVNAYTAEDISLLTNKINYKCKYILISSSAVYPENTEQPFLENSTLGENKYWGNYGLGKIEAEKELIKNVPDAYILRPAYLYGPYNNVYREAFVFDCVINNRKFYIPGNGDMKLQFFHIRDLCKCIENIIEKSPEEHIFNIGNEDVVSIKNWVEIIYKILDKPLDFIEVNKDIDQKKYFPFHDYEYKLDVNKQSVLLNNTISLVEGLKESYNWYVDNMDKVNRKEYIKYIEGELIISLDIATEKDTNIIHEMKKKAFESMYFTYRDDETSPYKEPIDKVYNGIKMENSNYYIINFNEKRIGAVRVVEKEEGIFSISPIFILPEYQNKGVGSIVMKKIFSAYESAVEWRLATILQEKGNCAFYEKLGFVKSGWVKNINEKMDIIGYEMKI